MSGEAQLLLMIAAVHLLGLGCVALLMIPALRDNPLPPRSEPDGGSDDGWGRRSDGPPRSPCPPSGGIPLPDAAPARVRLREPARLAERLPRRERRPVREPTREPVRR